MILIMELLPFHHDMRNIAVIGGWDGRKALNSVEFYNEQKREWEESRRTRLAQERRSPITATHISISISIKFVKFVNFKFSGGPPPLRSRTSSSHIASRREADRNIFRFHNPPFSDQKFLPTKQTHKISASVLT